MTLKEGERKVKDGGKGYEGSTLKEGEKKGEDQWRCSLCGAAFVEKEVLGYLDTVEASKLQVAIVPVGLWTRESEGREGRRSNVREEARWACPCMHTPVHNPHHRPPTIRAHTQGQIMYRGKAFPQAKAHFDATLALHAATPTGGASAASSSRYDTV